MKQLYLCRHAQAGTSASGDFYRELTPEGEKKARQLAAELVQARARPNILISSPAVRALQTANILAEALEYPVPRIVAEACFYEQDFETILHYLRGLDRELNKVMIVAHNPTLSALAGWLGGKPVELGAGDYLRLAFQVDEWYRAIHFRSAEKKSLPPRHAVPVDRPETKRYRAKKGPKA